MSLAWALDPASVFFLPYVASGLAVLHLVSARRASPRSIFSERFWSSRPVRTDLTMSAIHVLALEGPLEAFQVSVFGATYGLLRSRAPLATGPALPVALEAALAALVTVLSHDLATYVAHRLCHRSRFLWRFHSVHHSATHLNLFTIYRDHPLDHLLRNALRGAFTAGALAAFHLVFPRGTWGATYLGVGLGFLIYLPTVHLHHSHIPVRYPRWLRALLLSPHLHQLHHSSAPRHHDRNFGVIFPFWDRLFGTYLDEHHEQGGLVFGLAGPDPFRHSVLRCYLAPLTGLAQRESATRAEDKAISMKL